MLNALKGVYCDFGLPKRVLTDKRPCLRSQEFSKFHAKFGVSVEKSSAYNHQSVGSVERMVQMIKQIMTKNADNAWLAMLIFRATDIPGIDKSPGEILYGRKYQTGLPMIDIHDKSTEEQIEKLSEKRLKMKVNGNELAKLPVGTKVLYEKNPNLDLTKFPNGAKAQ